MEETMTLDGKTVTVRAPDGAPGPLPVVYLNVCAGDGGDVWGRCAELAAKRSENGANGAGAAQEPAFALVAISGLDWERDMTPWPAEPATRSEPPYTGKAAEHLAFVRDSVVPQVEGLLGKRGIGVAWRGVAGYSLAGLWALWSCWECDLWQRAASASGSLWYEGWLEYAAGHELATPLEAAYLSLGSKEHRTPNRLMRSVRENTERMRGLLAERGVAATLQVNPGNHFREPDLRMARGIQWLLDHNALASAGSATENHATTGSTTTTTTTATEDPS